MSSEVLREDVDAIIAAVRALASEGGEGPDVIHHASRESIELLFSSGLGEDEEPVAHQLNAVVC